MSANGDYNIFEIFMDEALSKLRLWTLDNFQSRLCGIIEGDTPEDLAKCVVQSEVDLLDNYKVRTKGPEIEVKDSVVITSISPVDYEDLAAFCKHYDELRKQ